MFRFFRSRVLDTLKYMPGPHYIRLTHLYMPYIMLIYSYTRIIYRSYTPFIALYTPYTYLDTPYIHLFLTIIPRAALDTRRVGYNYLISNKRYPLDDLRFSNTTGILQKKKTMWFIGDEVEQ